MESKIIEEKDNLIIQAYKRDGIILKRGHEEAPFKQIVLLSYKEFEKIVRFIQELKRTKKVQER